MNCNCCHQPRIICSCKSPCVDVAQVQQVVTKVFKSPAQLIAEEPKCDVVNDIVYSRPEKGVRLDSREKAMQDEVKQCLLRELGIAIPEVTFTPATTSQSYDTVTSSSVPSSGGSSSSAPLVCPELADIDLVWVKIPDGDCSTTQVALSVNVVEKSTRENGLKDFYYGVAVTPSIGSQIEVSLNGGYTWSIITTNSTNVTLDTSTANTLNGYNILIRASNTYGVGIYSLVVNPLNGNKVLTRIGGWENRPDGCTYNQYQLLLPFGVSISSLNLQSTGDVVYIVKPNNNIEIRGCKGELAGTAVISCGSTSLTRTLPAISINGDCTPCADCDCVTESSVSFSWAETSVQNQYLVTATVSPVWLTSPITWSPAGNLELVENSTSLSVLVNVTAGTGCLDFEVDALCDSIDQQTCKLFSTATTSDCSPTFASVTTTPATCNGSVAQSNGRITVSGITNGNRFGYSTGVSYTGPGYTGLTAMGYQIIGTSFSINNLPNPVGASQIYTVRLFNGSDSCYRDISVALSRTVCSGATTTSTPPTTSTSSSTPPSDCTYYTVYGGNDPEAGTLWSYVYQPCCQEGLLVDEVDGTVIIQKTICAVTDTVANVVGTTGIVPGEYCDECGSSSSTTSSSSSSSTPICTGFIMVNNSGSLLEYDYTNCAGSLITNGAVLNGDDVILCIEGTNLANVKIHGTSTPVGTVSGVSFSMVQPCSGGSSSSSSSSSSSTPICTGFTMANNSGSLLEYDYTNCAGNLITNGSILNGGNVILCIEGTNLANVKIHGTSTPVGTVSGVSFSMVQPCSGGSSSSSSSSSTPPTTSAPPTSSSSSSESGGAP